MSVKPTNPVVNHSHPLARGLVGAWAFEDGGGSVLRDVAGRGHNGTLTNMDPATDWVVSQHGGALDFDGSDDYVSVDSPLDWGGAVSFYCRAMMTAQGDGSGSGHDIFLLEVVSGSDMLIFYFNDGVELRLLSINTGSIDAQYTTALDDGKFHDLAFVVQPGDYARVYIDGVMAVEDSTPGTMSYSSTPTVFFGGEDDVDRGWDGQISDIRLWNRALSAGEIAGMYAGDDLYEPAIDTFERYYHSNVSAGQPAFKRWGQRTNQPIFGRGF